MGRKIYYDIDKPMPYENYQLDKNHWASQGMVGCWLFNEPGTIKNTIIKNYIDNDAYITIPNPGGLIKYLNNGIVNFSVDNTARLYYSKLYELLSSEFMIVINTGEFLKYNNTYQANWGGLLNWRNPADSSGLILRNAGNYDLGYYYDTGGSTLKVTCGSDIYDFYNYFYPTRTVVIGYYQGNVRLHADNKFNSVTSITAIPTDYATRPLELFKNFTTTYDVWDADRYWRGVIYSMFIYNKYNPNVAHLYQAPYQMFYRDLPIFYSIPSGAYFGFNSNNIPIIGQPMGGRIT